MSTTATNTTPPDRSRPSFRRRSQRIPLAMPVEVSGRDGNEESFTFATTATNLNRNGATLHVNRDLPIDTVIVLKNSRGARTSARIVARVSIVQDLCSYGVEFLGGMARSIFGALVSHHAG